MMRAGLTYESRAVVNHGRSYEALSSMFIAQLGCTTNLESNLLPLAWRVPFCIHIRPGVSLLEKQCLHSALESNLQFEP